MGTGLFDMTATEENVTAYHHFVTLNISLESVIVFVRVPRRSCSRITTSKPRPPRIPHLRFQYNGVIVDERQPLSAPTQIDEVRASDDSLDEDNQVRRRICPKRNECHEEQSAPDGRNTNRVTGVTAYHNFATRNSVIITAA